MLDFLKNRSDKKQLRELPEILKPENPVNYNSVLDYLTGLSKSDFAKIIKSAEIYREANAKVAKVVGVKDEPTHHLMPEKPSDEQVDKDLDDMLQADDLGGSLLDIESTPDAPEPKKPQAPANSKKIDVKE